MSQLYCSWRCGFFDSLNTNPNPDPNDILGVCRGYCAIGYTDWKVWIYHLWHPALMPVQCLLDCQCPWSCRLCSSLNPHTNPKCSLLLLLRSPSQVFALIKKLWSEQSWSCYVMKILHFINSEMKRKQLHVMEWQEGHQNEPKFPETCCLYPESQGWLT